MAILWTIFFVSCLVYSNTQHIYENDENVCRSEEKNSGTISTLLTELMKIQRKVDQLEKENTEIRNLLKCFKLSTDCKELNLQGHKQSGVYMIYPFNTEKKVNVYCDMVTEGGGWTAIQKRASGSMSFNRIWSNYREGFGNPNDSYWIGNDMIHQLTKGRSSSLYISITLQDGTTLYELYQQFSVSSEEDNYRLYLGGPATGTLGDAMLDTGYSNFDLSGMYFSTPDRDNDRDGGNCAVRWGGGWWHNACYRGYLNGPSSSNIWDPTLPNGREIKETVMMIKPN